MRYFVLTYGEKIVSLGDFADMEEADEAYDKRYRGIEDMDGALWLFSEDSIRELQEKIGEALRVGTPRLTEEDVMGALNLSDEEWDGLPSNVRQYLADSFNAGD